MVVLRRFSKMFVDDFEHDSLPTSSSKDDIFAFRCFFEPRK